MRHPTQAAIGPATAVLEALSPYVERVQIAGSIRRGSPTVKDIEIVAEPKMAADGLFGERKPMVEEIRQVAEKLGRVTKGGARYIQIADTAGSGITTDLFLVHPPAHWGVILAIRTGPARFSQMLVTKVKGRLCRVEQGRVLNEHGHVIPCGTEQEFFRAAGVEWEEPEARLDP